jgi:hypothetical protein
MHTTRHQASSRPTVERYAPSGVPSALVRTPVTPQLLPQARGIWTGVKTRPPIRRWGGDHLDS